MFKLLAIIISLTSPPNVMWAGSSTGTFADRAACEKQLPLDKAKLVKMLTEHDIKARVEIVCADKAALDAAQKKLNQENSI